MKDKIWYIKMAIGLSWEKKNYRSMQLTCDICVSYVYCNMMLSTVSSSRVLLFCFFCLFIFPQLLGFYVAVNLGKNCVNK